MRAIRRFNRFYTRQIGVLSRSYLGSEFTLAESRVLYEIAHHDAPTAALLCRELGLDQGYLSRILRGFELRGLLARTPSESDGRKSHVALTEAGRSALEELDVAASRQVASMLAGVPAPDRRRLLGAMRDIEDLLGGRGPRRGSFRLRTHGAGDLGWIVERHGALYSESRGWDQRFESLVAKVAADFAARGDTERERCWIAERAGVRAGSVLLVARSATVAQLRLLLVEPEARGRGIGRALVEACIDFARKAGYRRIVLWTEAGLVAAARLYASVGFRMTTEKHETRYGGEFISQTWELPLVPGPRRSRAR